VASAFTEYIKQSVDPSEDPSVNALLVESHDYVGKILLIISAVDG
jgi:hypothetical protein